MKIPTKAIMTDAQLEMVARQFAILSEPSRLRLLQVLMEGPLTVTGLVEATGLKQGNVSKHLGILLEARFVVRTREGNFARYSIEDPKLFTLCELMCGRVLEVAARQLEELGQAPPPRRLQNEAR